MNIGYYAGVVSSSHISHGDACPFGNVYSSIKVVAADGKVSKITNVIVPHNMESDIHEGGTIAIALADWIFKTGRFDYESKNIIVGMIDGNGDFISSGKWGHVFNSKPGVRIGTWVIIAACILLYISDRNFNLLYSNISDLFSWFSYNGNAIDLINGGISEEQIYKYYEESELDFFLVASMGLFITCLPLVWDAIFGFFKMKVRLNKTWRYSKAKRKKTKRKKKNQG